VSDTKPLRFSANGTPTRKRRRRSSPLVVDAKRLAKLLGCAVRSIRTWDAAGKLPMPLRLGGRVVWRVAEIRAWLDAGAPDRETWTSIRDARLK
jgi:predicted DNA-binding transcriptional regulator AlpA